MRSLAVAALLASLLGQTALAADTCPNRYALDVLVANKASYQPATVDPGLINAWGIAIRPAGMGGHFWVTAADKSFEYVGDVRQSPDAKLRTLHTDALKTITLPVGGKDNFATGTAFNGSTDQFVIAQNVSGKAPITAPAKFLFASDGGIVSAWTERKVADGVFDWPDHAVPVIDLSGQGSQLFGLTVSHDSKRLYLADFGQNPKVLVYDGQFKPVAVDFPNPFSKGAPKPGDYVPFNVQALKTPAGENRIFVAYAKSQSCPAEAVKEGTCKAGDIWPGEEDSGAGKGRLAEFTEEGKLVAVWKDDGKLDAPWGVVYAPDNFGALSGHLLVANFGDGLIVAFDPVTRQAVDVLRDADGKPLEVEKAWGLLFGNGASLGDTNALYVAAGPEDEVDGLFGAIRPVSGQAVCGARAVRKL